MSNEKETVTPQGESNSDSNSNIQASESTYTPPEEAMQSMLAWLYAKRLKKFRRMKQSEGGEGWREMPAVAKEFHSSSPGGWPEGGRNSGSADVVAFQGESGAEVAFVERGTSYAADTASQPSDGVPVC